jgi:hypothetical protein
LDVLEDHVRDRRATEEEDQTDHHPGGPFGGDIDKHQHDPEEHQRSAEILLEHQHAQRDAPGRQQRGEVSGSGQLHAEHFAAGGGEQITFGHQECGNENHDQDLGELTRLDGQPA